MYPLARILSPLGYQSPPGGGAAAFTPADLASLALWLRGDSITGLAEGGAVATWPDSAPGAHNATQASSGSRPTYRASAGPGGKPCVQFAGSTIQYLTLPNFLTGYTAGDLFVVWQADADPPVYNGLWELSFPGVANVFWSDGVFYDGNMSTTRYTNGDPAPSMTNWRLHEVRSAPGSWSSHIDGTQLFSSATNTVNWSASPEIGRSGGVYGLAGRIAEFLVFSAVLSSGDRSSVHGYLASKYGLTIA